MTPADLKGDRWNEDGERIRAVEEFAAGTVHALGAPLTTLRLVAERLAEREGPGKELLNGSAGLLLEQVHRIEEVFRQLVYIADPPEAQPRPLDLNLPVRDAVGMFEAAAGPRRSPIRLYLAPSAVPVKGDLDQLRHAFCKLLNVVVGRDSAGTQIRVRTRARGNWAHLVVVWETEPLLGAPATVLVRGGRADMDGLELMQVRQIIHRYGGVLQVRDRPSSRAASLILLPLGANGAST